MRPQKSEQTDPHQQPANRLKRASDSAKKLVWLKMAECSAPAVVVGVAVNGKPVWKHGRGSPINYHILVYYFSI